MPRGDGTGPMWWHGRFRGCGYRITVGREAILDVLTRADKHLSAEDIYMKVHAIYPAVGLTTIYRTLEILVDLGLVFKFDFGDGRARYELAEGSKRSAHHHHLICTGCKRIIDYTDFIDDEIELLKQTEKGLSKKYNFMITNHLIQFYGLCEKCKKRK
ncbi:MAG: transcriptional repressor [Candidatus Omnitrophica bacterium]|nr:transcriptional repressor [Candidatus Omnitrophota bacterium]MBU4488499.1 transcriptional repressor [Candidatus Omnitrophota bacterium]MCG2704589.1 transcriptional repressor [Candidatus Omnitrophota bacterium]